MCPTANNSNKMQTMVGCPPIRQFFKDELKQCNVVATEDFIMDLPAEKQVQQIIADISRTTFASVAIG
jgi:hypothetical protein